MQGSGEIGARPLPDAYVRRATARLKYKAAPPPHAPLVPDFKASVSSSKVAACSQHLGTSTVSSRKSPPDVAQKLRASPLWRLPLNCRLQPLSTSCLPNLNNSSGPRTFTPRHHRHPHTTTSHHKRLRCPRPRRHQSSCSPSRPRSGSRGARNCLSPPRPCHHASERRRTTRRSSAASSESSGIEPPRTTRGSASDKKPRHSPSHSLARTQNSRLTAISTVRCLRASCCQRCKCATTCKHSATHISIT